jgi:hypothetical protein
MGNSKGAAAYRIVFPTDLFRNLMCSDSVIYGMAQVDKTRNRFLARARQAEERALAQQDTKVQDELLDQTVWLRLLANLPTYNPGLR